MEPVTLITGGSSGIGAATARVLLQQGHRVATTGRDADRLAAFATSTGAGKRLLTISGDAGDESHVAAAVRQVAGLWGRLDTVIANAGFPAGASKRIAVVSLVAQHSVEPAPGPAPASTDRWHGIKQGDGLGDVVDVSSGGDHRHRDPAAVADQVVFRARFAAVDR